MKGERRAAILFRLILRIIDRTLDRTDVLLLGTALVVASVRNNHKGLAEGRERLHRTGVVLGGTYTYEVHIIFGFLGPLSLVRIKC